MLLCLPGTHIDADFRPDSQSRGFANAVNLSQIHSRNPIRFMSAIESWIIPSILFLCSGGLDWIGFNVDLRFQTPQIVGNPLITTGDLFLVEIKQFDRLL